MNSEGSDKEEIRTSSVQHDFSQRTRSTSYSMETFARCVIIFIADIYLIAEYTLIRDISSSVVHSSLLRTCTEMLVRSPLYRPHLLAPRRLHTPSYPCILDRASHIVRVSRSDEGAALGESSHFSSSFLLSSLGVSSMTFALLCADVGGLHILDWMDDSAHQFVTETLPEPSRCARPPVPLTAAPTFLPPTHTSLPLLAGASQTASSPTWGSMWGWSGQQGQLWWGCEQVQQGRWCAAPCLPSLLTTARAGLASRVIHRWYVIVASTIPHLVRFWG